MSLARTWRAQIHADWLGDYMINGAVHVLFVSGPDGDGDPHHLHQRPHDHSGRVRRSRRQVSGLRRLRALLGAYRWLSPNAGRSRASGLQPRPLQTTISRR